MKLPIILSVGGLLMLAACAPVREPPPSLAVTPVQPPPITGTVVVQPQP